MATSIRQLNSSLIAPSPPKLGRPDTWSDVLKHYAVDEVVAVTEWDQSAIWNELAEACADRGVIFRQLVVMPRPKIGKYHIEDAGNGRYFVSLETVPQDFFALAVKRTVDIVGCDLWRMLVRDDFSFLCPVAASRVARSSVLPPGTDGT